MQFKYCLCHFSDFEHLLIQKNIVTLCLEIRYEN